MSEVISPIMLAPVSANLTDKEVVLVHAHNHTHRVVRRSLETELRRQESIAQRSSKNPIVLKVSLDQTRHRTRLIKLKPAITYLQNNVKYEIVQGNDDGIFEMRSHNHGTASLHFKHHLHQPATYDIEIVGRPLDYSNINDGAHSDLDMNLRIIVTH